jgi:hypothetical protein
MKKQISPAMAAVVIVIALILAVMMGSRFLAEKPHSVGVMNGKEMTEEEGQEFGRRMSGNRSGGTTPAQSAPGDGANATSTAPSSPTGQR